MARRDDGVILQQMIDYARETVALSRGRTRADLDNDRLFNLAMTRLLEVIGESAVQLSESTRQKSTTIPWSQIIAVRNRLIHGYDQINCDILWDIIELDIPKLVIELDAVSKRVSRQ
jgi:uncharacterized protein with HEPN domain